MESYQHVSILSLLAPWLWRVRDVNSALTGQTSVQLVGKHSSSRAAMELGPCLTSTPHGTDTSILANNSAAFKWKLRCYWFKYCVTVVGPNQMTVSPERSILSGIRVPTVDDRWSQCRAALYGGYLRNLTNLCIESIRMTFRIAKYDRYHFHLDIQSDNKQMPHINVNCGNSAKAPRVLIGILIHPCLYDMYWDRMFMAAFSVVYMPSWHSDKALADNRKLYSSKGVSIRIFLPMSSDALALVTKSWFILYNSNYFSFGQIELTFTSCNISFFLQMLHIKLSKLWLGLGWDEEKICGKWTQ